jgi:antitoxin VapB
MSDALVVEDHEAAELARELAERRGVTVEQAVVDSLRTALDTAVRPPGAGIEQGSGPVQVPSLEDMTSAQRAALEELQALVADARPYVIPGATSDHSDLYDEHGLPV